MGALLYTGVCLCHPFVVSPQEDINDIHGTHELTVGGSTLKFYCIHRDRYSGDSYIIHVHVYILSTY